MINWSSILGAITNAISGGTTSEIITAILLVVAVGVVGYFQMKMNEQAASDATNSTNTTGTDVNDNSDPQSGTQENQMGQDQAALTTAEGQAKLALLMTFPDAELISLAISAYGATSVQSAIGQDPTVALTAALTVAQRTAIYTLYGV